MHADDASIARRWQAARARNPADRLEAVRRIQPAPRWIAGQDRFWYARRNGAATDYVLFDAETGAHAPAFDHEGVAKSLAALGFADATPTALDITDLHVAGPNLRFERGGRWFEGAVDGSDLAADMSVGPAELADPTGRYAAFARGHNLWVREIASGSAKRVTTDGVEHYAYGEAVEFFEPHFRGLSLVRTRRSGVPHPLMCVVWSPDGRYLLALRTDRRALRAWPYVTEFAPPDARYTIANMARLEISGEHVVAPRTLAVVDTLAGVCVRTDIDTARLQDFAAMHLSAGVAWWDLPRSTVFVETANRRGDTYGLVAIDLTSGASRQVYAEHEEHYFTFNQHDYSKPNMAVLPHTREFIWYSQRSGWGHLYLHDLDTGEAKRPITQGEWVVRDVVHIDETGRIVYFSATGRQPGRNPYYKHLYRVGFDGGEPQLLTPEDADHEFERPNFRAYSSTAGSSVSPSGRFIVDTYSTVWEPPVTVVRRSDGGLVAEVARPDTTELQRNRKPPQPITTLAADGETVLYGAMYTPHDFDPNMRYAVVDLSYPGPQAMYTPTTFAGGFFAMNVYDGQLLADLGFVVVSFDGRGSTGRSKRYRYAFAATEDIYGSADQRSGITNLAAQHPFIDVERVGIAGASYGGYAALRAALLQPDFFAACVSAVGPHDFGAMPASIACERFFLHSDDPAEADAFYALTSNTRIADRLACPLLLIYGEIDENLLLNQAFLIFEALQQADKDYETLILPNQPHSAYTASYATRQIGSFFMRHLGGPIERTR